MEIVMWSKRVREFIHNLDIDVSRKTIEVIELLEEQGHLLDMPDSKSLGKGLFELRVQGRSKVRVLYIFHNNKAYVLHAFIKKTWKIPFKDIEYARRVQREIINLA